MKSIKLRKFDTTSSLILLLVSFFILAVLAKIYQYNYSSPDNFIIMNRILNGIRFGEMTGVNSFDFPIKVYSLLKFLGIDSNIGWSIFWCGISNIMILFYFYRKQLKLNIIDLIYIFSTMFILDFTVFNANKDMIQFIFMLLILVTVLSTLSNFWKIVISSGIFLLESILFRSYYVITGGLIIIAFLVYLVICKIKLTKKNIGLSLIFFTILIFFIAIFIASHLLPNMYDELANRRDVLENIDANTIIRNLVPGDSFFIFVINYFINAIRMCFPFEIFNKGFLMSIFAIYQSCLSLFLLLNLKNITKKNVIIYIIVISFMLTMFASESDFGTFTRHESILFLLLIEIKFSVNRERFIIYEKSI